MNYTLKEIKSCSATAENPDALSGQGGKGIMGEKDVRVWSHWQQE